MSTEAEARAEKFTQDYLLTFGANERKIEREEIATWIEHWRECICDGKTFETECGHAINCWHYITAEIRKRK